VWLAGLENLAGADRLAPGVANVVSSAATFSIAHLHRFVSARLAARCGRQQYSSRAWPVMLHAIRRVLTRVGESTTHPAAFAIVAGYAVAWLFFSPETFSWVATATLATWLMTLFHQQNRATRYAGNSREIDELLRSHVVGKVLCSTSRLRCSRNRSPVSAYQDNRDAAVEKPAHDRGNQRATHRTAIGYVERIVSRDVSLLG
jgi:low affinity Fe/Cu permease